MLPAYKAWGRHTRASRSQRIAAAIAQRFDTTPVKHMRARPTDDLTGSLALGPRTGTAADYTRSSPLHRSRCSHRRCPHRRQLQRPCFIGTYDSEQEQQLHDASGRRMAGRPRPRHPAIGARLHSGSRHRTREDLRRLCRAQPEVHGARLCRTLAAAARPTHSLKRRPARHTRIAHR